MNGDCVEGEKKTLLSLPRIKPQFWDFRFSWQCYWRFMSSGMWQRQLVDRWGRKKDESHIQATEMEFLKGIKRHTLHNQICNRNMRWPLNVLRVLGKIIGNKDKWREHIEWMRTGARRLPSVPTLSGQPCKKLTWSWSTSEWLSPDMKSKDCVPVDNVTYLWRLESPTPQSFVLKCLFLLPKLSQWWHMQNYVTALLNF
jgi:hypothetical protein